jgi:tetratricopeptide (TPR) repeat protein
MKRRAVRLALAAAIGLITLSLLAGAAAGHSGGSTGPAGPLTHRFPLGTQTLSHTTSAPARGPATTPHRRSTPAPATTPHRSTPAPATHKSGAHGGIPGAILIGLGAVLALAGFFTWWTISARRRKRTPREHLIAPKQTGTLEPAQNGAGPTRSRVSAKPASEPGRWPRPARDPAHAPESPDREQRRRKRRAERAKTAVVGAEESQLARPLPLDEVGDARQNAVLALASADPEALQWLQAEIGEPPDPDRVRTLIARWPQALAGSFDLVAVATVRHAEALGLWSDAADAWEHLAAQSSDGTRGDRLVRAAIDAELAGDDARNEHLLTDAAEADPDCPRLHLRCFDPDSGPRDQLARLEGIDTDDSGLGAIVACQKALTSLRLGDLDSAAEHLARAEQLGPESVATRATAINLRVQRARVALSLNRRLSLAEALSAQQDAISLRRDMIAIGRWSEAGRLLMLAADVSCMLRDPEGGEQLLRLTKREELAAPGASHVLGDAALRCDAPELALELTEHAERSDAITRIRAAAGVQLGGRLRAEGLDALEKLALSDSPERERAAAARLSACSMPVVAAWNEQVADVLADTAHAGTVARLRLMSIACAGDVGEAERRAANLPNDAASAESRLWIAQMGGRPDAIRKAAKRLLDIAPDASRRLSAAATLAAAGDWRRAGEIATPIAHDPESPPRVRADAFVTLLRTLADQGLWQDAAREWQAFRDLSSQSLGGGDGRVSAWQARILHHRGYHGADR